MIAFSGVGKHYGGSDVLRGVSCEIRRGEKTGLIGANGAGKTTFVRLLLGLEQPTTGAVSRAAGVRIGYAAQHLVDAGETVLEFLLDDYSPVAEEVRRREDALASTPPARAAAELARYQQALDALEAAGGMDVPERARGAAASLGFAADRRVGSLSGGEQNALALARAMLLEPDLLVLDEPGNHLDFAGLMRLEETLVEFRGAILLVSHDRYLLDRVTTRTFEIERGSLAADGGGYSRYRLEKLRGLVAQQADYVANQKRLSRLENLVRRFEQIARNRPDPAWGRRLKARRTQLERERRAAVERPITEDSRIALRVDAESSRADIALRVRGYSRSAGDRELFRDADLEVSAGERVALLGPNGCGKSTFLRDLVEAGSWENPVLRVGPSMRLGYCAQHQETLDWSRSVYEHLLAVGPRNRTEAFGTISPFLFAWADLDKKIGDLSGGERNRLQLARLAWERPNLLILDEPTNHMDIPSREAVEESLADYSGTIVVVSHDRYFLESLGAGVVEVRDLGFHRFADGIVSFWEERRMKVKKAPAAARRTAVVGAATADVETLERRLAETEAERKGLEKKLAAALAQGDHDAGRRLGARIDRLSRVIERLYEEWERRG